MQCSPIARVSLSECYRYYMRGAVGCVGRKAERRGSLRSCCAGLVSPAWVVKRVHPLNVARCYIRARHLVNMCACMHGALLCAYLTQEDTLVAGKHM